MKNEYKSGTNRLHFYHKKLFIFTFEELNNKFGIDNKAMSNIKREDIGRDISLTPMEIKMRDQKLDSVANPEFNNIVNVHPTNGTHWVLVIRREDDLILCITLIVLVFIIIRIC